MFIRLPNGSGNNLASDKEDEFFAMGVYSKVFDRSKKRSLAQYHAKIARCRPSPATRLDRPAKHC